MGEFGGNSTSLILMDSNLTSQSANSVTSDCQPHSDSNGILRADERFEHMVFHLWIDSIPLVDDLKNDILLVFG